MDVYIIRSRSVPRAYYALTHTYGCIVYIPPGGIESVRSIGKAVVGPNSGTGSRRYPHSFCIVEYIVVKPSDTWVSVRPFVADRCYFMDNLNLKMLYLIFIFLLMEIKL
jgi:hypothetical protein